MPINVNAGLLGNGIDLQQLQGLLGGQGTDWRSSLGPLLLSLGAGIASGGAPGGGGLGAGIGRGLAGAQEAIQNTQSREQQALAQQLQLLMLQNTLRHQQVQEDQAAQGLDLQRFNALPEAIRDQLPFGAILGSPIASGAGVQSPILPPIEFEAKKAATKAAAEAKVKATADIAELNRGGASVLRMVDSLQQKINKDKPLFEQAAGPVSGEASEGSALFNPGRIGFEAFVNRKAKSNLSTIKQTAQAINTSMQRALLKGGGSITENERQQINQILGSIHTARSADEAVTLLDNFKGLVASIFQIQQPSTAPQSTINSEGVIDFNEFFGR